MYRILHEKPFNNCVISLLESSALTEAEYRRTAHNQNYQLELSRSYLNGVRNPNLLFELFGSYSDEPATKVRECMINSVRNDMSDFKVCCKMALQLKGMSAENWITQMEQQTTPGDELCLYLLGRLYYRHSIVVNKFNVWCTIDTSIRTSTKQLFEWCCICLVYLGNKTFGVLKSNEIQTRQPYFHHTQELNSTVTGHAQYGRVSQQRRCQQRQCSNTRGRFQG